MIEPFFDNEGMTLYEGDSMQLLRGLPENSIDCCVTDPPYALVSIQKRFSGPGAAECQYGTDGAYRRAARGFLGKDWDCGETVNNPEFWAEVLRVLKPGGFMLSFGGTRTQHRQVCAIEDAGFEIRDMICYHYGSGFPKSLNVSKQLDKQANVTREVVGIAADFARDGAKRSAKRHTIARVVKIISDKGEGWDRPITAPATDEAKQWDGFGSALKPATETICLARKPLSESSIAANVLKWGTGALNIDKCRINATDGYTENAVTQGINSARTSFAVAATRKTFAPNKAGRWPANAIFSESAAAELDRQSGESKDGTAVKHNSAGNNIFSDCKKPVSVDVSYQGAGGASRFFYVPKPSQAERNMGCEGLPLLPKQGHIVQSEGRKMHGESERFPTRNNHPTVKPVQLLRYLIKLICPPGGVVLDPFMGSGSTGIAAVCEGVRFVGMEREPEYMKIAVARIKHAQCNSGLFDLFDAPETPQPAQAQQGLFSEESN